MGQLIQLRAGDADIVIQAARQPGEVTPVGVVEDVVRKVDVQLAQAFQTVLRIAESFRTAIDPKLITKAELELGLQFTGKGTIFVVQSEGQASLKVKLTFGGKE